MLGDTHEKTAYILASIQDEKMMKIYLRFKTQLTIIKEYDEWQFFFINQNKEGLLGD